MELLRKVASFNPPIDDLKTIYVMYVRSILEYCAHVWSGGILKKDSLKIENIQKSVLSFGQQKNRI